MLLFFKRLMLAVAAAALLSQTAFAFSLLGPRDTWQTSNLGYDPQGDLGDIGGPKNLGEEWRWVVPRITYAFDQSFIDFFGTNGVNAVEEAIFLFNKEMTNLSTLSDAALRAKPRDTKRIHQTAQSLGVLDLKSAAMGLLAEQLGLADAVRWTWALRDQQVFANNVTNFTVIQRNFDPFTLRPTRYVNDHRWTYFIGQFPTGVGGGTYVDAAEIAIDQAGDQPFMTSAVSSMVGENLLSPGLREGEYYSALSRDDIGGLRYIYRANNVNPEVFVSPGDVVPPAIRVVDTNTIIFVPGFDAFTFFTNALFLNPSQLTGLYTNLVILSTNVTTTNVITTNFVVTNLVAGGLFTNTSLPTLISNQDLFTFSEASRTNNPGVLKALYPQLIVTRTNSGFVTQVTPVFSLTNSPYGQVGDPPIIVTNYVTNIVVNYRNEYANVITNYASAVTDMRILDVHRAPWATPTDFIFETNVTVFRTNLVSGGFYILDRSTNADLVSYSLYDPFGVPLLRTTNILESTNIVFVFTNIFDPFDIRIRAVENLFTNVVYAAFPVTLNSVTGQQIVQVNTTNLVPLFHYTFDTNNLLYFPPGNGNSDVILQTIVFTNGGPVRITQQPVFQEIPMGTVLFLDTNQFLLAGPRIETFGFVTNVLTSFTNAATGEFITTQLIYQTNSVQFAVYPVTFVPSTTPTLRPGVDTLQFVHQPYTDFLSQSTFIATNIYTVTAVTNGVAYTQTLRRIAGPDIVFSTFDQTTSGGFPVAYSRSINWRFNTQVIAPGATFNRGPGQVDPGSVLSFSSLSPSWIVQSPGSTTEENSILYLQWGSFDSRTLLPKLYPEDITGQLQTLEQIVLRKNLTPVQP